MDTSLDEHTINEVVDFLRKEANWLRQNYVPPNDFSIKVSIFTTINRLAMQIEQKELISR